MKNNWLVFWTLADRDLRLRTSRFRKEISGGPKFRKGDTVVARITPCLEKGKTGLITRLNDDEIAFGSTEFIIMRGRKQS
jgi:type I restriction enzyme S subunit